jgi:hypothetical protein
MIEYMRNNELVRSNADEREIEGFLARQIPAENAYEFYSLLRRESEAGEVKEKKKAVRKIKAEERAKTKSRKEGATV